MAGTITDDTEEFINSVEKRPALYYKSLKEYSDINLKRKLWEEVCMEVVPGWLELDPENKRKLGAEVQRKWLNLRTCFSRELKAQQTKSGQAAKKRRKYRFFEKLLILKSSLTQRSTDSNLETVENEDETETSDITELNVPKRQANTRNKKLNTNTKFEDSLLNSLKDDLNEDKHFALSLVPTLQSMTDDEKFQAKIEILQVCRRIKANKQHTQPSITISLPNNFIKPSRSYPEQFHAPSSNRILQPSSSYTGQFHTSSPNNNSQPTDHYPGDYTGQSEHVRQCPSASPQNSLDSLQSYVSSFTPSPQHSPMLDIN